MHPLDNVIYQALATRQAHLAQTSGQARRFIPEISPLAGLQVPSAEAYASLADLLPSQSTISLFLDAPYEARPGWTWIGGAPLLEMVCEEMPDTANDPEPAILKLGAEDLSQMLELTALTKPGPFDRRTRELGRFVGIRQDGKLVAMAGERLKVPGYTEVSAVCTHPEHAGHGYARILMTEVMRNIFAHGETPFLHVREDNLRALALYERLGFRTRVRVHYAILRKTAP